MDTGYFSGVGEAMLLPGFRPHFAEIDGVRTRYFLAGDGPPLTLVHGLGGAAVNFTKLAPILARKRRVLIPDLPGHGLSEPFERVEGIATYSRHVHAVAEREGMVPGAVLGYSMGGVVALRLAVEAPEDVTALALVAPAGIVSTTRRAEIWLAVTAALRPALVMTRFRGTFARRPRLRWLPFGLWGATDPAALDPDAVLGFLEGPSQHTDVGSAGRALLADDPRPDLDRVVCRTILVWGARDRLVPLADGFEYARRLRAPIRVLPAAGHLVVGELAEPCAALLEGFLDGVGEVDELPLEPELVRQLRRERTDA
jgi:4,5:9,10-diseco-3-hydroxy-5,9,17-trioxoandrosta-1(10),2-diene-4-oate hydrolase